MAIKRIVILGGGTGGALVANLLARKLRAREAEIVVVNDSPLHRYQPGLLYVPFGDEEPGRLARPLRGLLDGRIDLRIDRVVRLDTEARQVALEGGKDLDYDYLVVATGSVLFPEGVPGFVQAADHFYSEAAALALRDKLGDFRKGTILVGVGGLPYKCPVAPLEFTFLLDDFLRRRGVREQTTVRYTFPINAVFTIPTVASLAERMMREKGIEIETFFNLEAIDPVRRVASSLEGAEFPFDIAVFVPPHQGAAFLRGHPIADAQGWVDVDRTTLRARRAEGVWALGDTTNLPISKAGSTAHFEGQTVAAGIVAAVRGTEPEPDSRHAEYDGHVMCFLESGDRKATLLDFDYNRPPQPAEPSTLVHYGKLLFNKAYWHLVPTGRI